MTNRHELNDIYQGDAALVAQLPKTPLIQRAYALAVHAHHGQMRRSGDAYINHALRTALRLLNFGEEVICSALLHDVLEDSHFTAADLRDLNFPEAIISAVISVSKQAGETYEELVARAAANRIGRLVKLADNLDNSCPAQLACFNEEKKARQQRKYLPARIALRASIPTYEQVLIAA